MITMNSNPSTTSKTRSGLWRELYIQVIFATVLGVVIGYFWPNFGIALKPFGDGFIKLIRMLLAPIIFGTVVIGIAKMGSLKEVGRVGLKSLLYFEVVSSLALVIGLVLVNILRPGVGMNIDVTKLDPKEIAPYLTAAAHPKGDWVDFLLNIIPASVMDAFARGDMLQVILFSLLFGVAMASLREKTKPLFNVIESALDALFAVVGMVMRLAPLAALGAMAFTVGKYGIGTLSSLGQLLVAVYVSCALFVFGVLAAIARVAGFSLWRFLRYIKDEILIVFATCSTEAVLPQMIIKLENVGCAKPVVGMVLPAGYAFNPDGTSIYLTMASIFIAQATNTPLTLRDQLAVLVFLLASSKGSAGVAGAGFIVLAGSLAATGKIPLIGLALLLGVERFVNAARAVTNLIGNGVATIVIARWEKALDRERVVAVLEGEKG